MAENDVQIGLWHLGLALTDGHNGQDHGDAEHAWDGSVFLECVVGG